MKKKIKIFSTIASLCLAVALMAFGVYAATSISFTTTSKVSFKATDIAGYWSLEISGGDYNQESGKYKTGNDVRIAETAADAKGDQPLVEVKDIEDIELSAAANEVTYTITFTNTSTQVGAKVKLEHEFTTKPGYTYTVTNAGTAYTSGTVVDAAANNGTAVFVVKVTLNVEADEFQPSENSEATLTVTGTATNK